MRRIHIDGIPDFDSSTMISTLRIASSFDYPALRKFAISKLEGMNLPAIQRIQLSDEFSLPTWEIPAFTELCSRKEPVSQAEAEVLGMARFVEIARIRETERTRLAVKFTSDMYGELLQATNATSSSQAAGSDGSSSGQNHFVHPEFSFPDGNVEIQTTDYVFWVHEYYLNKFSVFATLIQAAKGSETDGESGRRTAIVCERKTNAEDIYNTLQVIYASHVDGIPDFDSSVMISTLRIATVFNYPALRKFAISKLEKMNLPAIQRIQLSDELSLPSWEAPAFTELCSRKEPISTTEAEVLGMTRFVEIARIRETERARWAVKLVKDVNRDLVQPLKSADWLKIDNIGEFTLSLLATQRFLSAIVAPLKTIQEPGRLFSAIFTY
ncbi:hypothetical protein RSOLAG22IIIB_00207 [Rhizoctonia solani]|uniref:BTB domain-containing protein n=1 Tax=Rhizoctonia solani TaxID=456999 RepID=A0A0K6FKH3_9AGAM|nr:hypothetical protein RSOLAG22IIIB_00207 [Rhizoctonia solani]